MKQSTNFLLAKARRALDAARRDLQAGDPESAISRIYYAAFHAATAALHEKGLAAKSHSGTQHLFSEHFILTGALDQRFAGIFSTLFQSRQKADYGSDAYFTLDGASQALERSEMFTEAIETLLNDEPGKTPQ